MQTSAIDNRCPYCSQAMRISRMTCGQCSVSIDTDFPDSPLSRLPLEHQRFIEIFVLAGGSLKAIAEQAGVSYPTVRNRLDKVIEQLNQELESSPSIFRTTDPQTKPRPKKQKPPTAAEILKNI